MSRTIAGKCQKLFPIKVAGIANVLDGKNTNADEHLKKHLPLVQCECGAKILLLPDLPAMNCAIKAHVTEHRKKGKNAKSNVNPHCNISQLLSQMSLKKIAEQNDI